MILGDVYRDCAQLVCHLPGGFSRIVVERYVTPEQVGWVGQLDVPTRVIPPLLRALGSRFVVARQVFWPEPHDSIEELRAAVERSTWVERAGE